jgi:hypothetical protein
MQKTVSLSTAEAEYYATSEMGIKVLYLRNLLQTRVQSMGFPQEPDTPVHEDKTARIEWGNHIVGGRERAEQHIDTRRHFAHEVIQHREMHLLIKADASKEIADMFTKPLPHPRYKACILAMLDARP